LRSIQTKNRSVCENTVTEIRGSCTLLVMGSGFQLISGRRGGLMTPKQAVTDRALAGDIVHATEIGISARGRARLMSHLARMQT